MLFIILVVLGYYFSIEKENNHIEVPEVVAVENNIKAELPQEPKLSEIIKNKKEINRKQSIEKNREEQEKDIDSLMVELSDNIFSSDPIEEFFSIFYELNQCDELQRILRTVENVERWSNEFVSIISDFCDNLGEQYPTVNRLKTNRKFKSVFIDKLLDSKHADIFQRLMMRENTPELFEDRIRVFLASKNSSMIKSLKHSDKTFLKDKVSAKLKTVNKKYVDQITDEALEVYACRFNQGNTCTPYNVFMFQKCVKKRELCEKDTLFWFNEFISPGHKRDIEIVMEIFESINS